MVAGQNGLDSEIAYKHGDEVVLSEYVNVLAGAGRFAVPRGQGAGWQAGCAASSHNQAAAQWSWMARAFARVRGASPLPQGSR